VCPPGAERTFALTPATCQPDSNTERPPSKRRPRAPEAPGARRARSNNGQDWAENVLPVFEGLSVKRTDIVVANFALWINKEPELRANLTAFADYAAAHGPELPFLIWRDSSVQHFNTPDGDYVGVNWPWACRAIGDDPDAVRLAPDGRLSSDREELQVWLGRGCSQGLRQGLETGDRAEALPRVESASVRLLRPVMEWLQYPPRSRGCYCTCK